MKGIIIHCSDSPHGRGDNAKTIHSWHKERGFDGIGYHHVITEEGFVEQGRPEYWIGAHAKGYNDYIGICLIGIKEFTDLQYQALADLIEAKKLEYDISNVNIMGHYQVSNKTCPNFDVRNFMYKRGIR